MALAVRHGAAAAGAQRAEGVCVRFTERCGIGLFRDGNNTEYNCFARVARNGLAKDGKHKLGSIFHDKDKRYGWAWQASTDPKQPRNNITKIWDLVHTGAEIGLPALGMEGAASRVGDGYWDNRQQRQVRLVALKGEKGADVGFVTDPDATVNEVKKDGDAHKAGVRKGWVVKTVNGIKVENYNQINEVMLRQKTTAVTFGFDTSAVVSTKEKREEKGQQGKKADRPLAIITHIRHRVAHQRPAVDAKERRRSRDRNRERSARNARDRQAQTDKDLEDLFAKANISNPAALRIARREGLDAGVLPYCTVNELCQLGFKYAWVVALQVAMG
eukprot:gene10218-11864_t